MNTSNAELVLTAGLTKQLIHDNLPQFAFSGRSNVGKSSLINTLLNRKSLARVSAQPGKTITVNYYKVDNSLYLVDLPGYGYAKRSASEQAKWSELVNTYIESKEMRCIIQLIDLKVGPTKDDIMMFDWMNDVGIPYIIVATKSDKLNTTNKKAALESLRNCEFISPEAEIIEFSALKKTGKDEVWQKIISML
ncbi:MAG: YihA family ribosome biogenesis GTP-binding protein [Ruminococcaceae bacterium]|nr:YihA family ribosome biogenesis GTP-binding protein [Oscillospiraceae bacterium]